MSLFQNLLIITALILISSFFSISEIALAGARKIKLKLLAEVRERVIGEDENMTELEPYGDRYSTVCDRNAFRSEQLESLDKLKGEI